MSSTNVVMQILAHVISIAGSLCLHYLITINPVTLCLLACFFNLCVHVFYKQPTTLSKIYDLPEAPGPRSWPLIGTVLAITDQENPFRSFTDLAKKYGPIVKLQIGSMPAIVVNGKENIWEVLMSKGQFFDGRPNVQRYADLFGGDRDNSLAFCDWSEKHKARREVLKPHSFPSSFSARFEDLDDSINKEMSKMIQHVMEPRNHGVVDIKDVIFSSCFSIFTDYFSSRTFSAQASRDVIASFDAVFYEVNQGRIADYFPVLYPLNCQLTRMKECANDVRRFVEQQIVQERFNKPTPENKKRVDLIDALIEYVRENNDGDIQFDYDTVLYAFEDIIGGHTAVGSFLVKTMDMIAHNPHVQTRIQQDIDKCLKAKRDNPSECEKIVPEVDLFGEEHENVVDYESIQSYLNTNASHSFNNKEKISIKDRHMLPYIEATILEGIRMISSPIVPHVANQDTSIAGFRVPKDTMVILNTHELNTSEALWDKPHEFNPDRFVKNGRIHKPDYFLPFGGGKRSCMGYKMVQLISFGILANFFQNFKLKPIANCNNTYKLGHLALENQQYNYHFETRWC